MDIAVKPRVVPTLRVLDVHKATKSSAHPLLFLCNCSHNMLKHGGIAFLLSMVLDARNHS